MASSSKGFISIVDDKRFQRALDIFNSGDWYTAHDAFEELWHETYGPEKITLQGILQTAVAQVHLEQGNRNGAIILFGEAVGRLTKLGAPDLGLDINRLCDSIEQRMDTLRLEGDPELVSVPFLLEKDQGVR